jgi:hypothetical protein
MREFYFSSFTAAFASSFFASTADESAAAVGADGVDTMDEAGMIFSVAPPAARGASRSETCDFWDTSVERLEKDAMGFRGSNDSPAQKTSPWG